MNNQEILVRASRAAALLGSSLETLRWWTRKGLLRRVTIGRSVYYERAELERFIDEHRDAKKERRPDGAALKETDNAKPSLQP